MGKEILTGEQKKDIQYLGFCVGEEDERGYVAVASETIPDLTSLELLLNILTFWEEIKYWDAEKYSPTDPGGYVTALRWDADSVAYREGNQGWSSRWQIVSIKEMAKHMQKNWDKDYNGGKYRNRIQVCHNNYIGREQIAGELKK